ncbi:putative diphthamide synthesis protein-domain-containing protein [Emericellopsis atlantica]|uniref:2-(3-amino-3-carboxypropyl)histidine synthase subunit 2 n=1 Tax=Emericellopsis atlantica TaxID=2614577 RepID=A0A9P7ZU38_9HYPO|nr:putative diphthamide synthesis protein-domain-containing protein [Emericellopsis atlantica]KAG9258394.1 putative diphthamide synthesis protein-domain-containing protein [Emericellopsis atlantica]
MADLAAPPVLSTPDDHILTAEPPLPAAQKSTLSADVLSRIYEIPRTIDSLVAGGYKRIALQFPDTQLPDAPAVSTALSEQLPPDAKVHILADTSYSACCVDEVAAEHVEAEVVVHYGRACLSPTSRLPVIYVYTAQELDLPDAVNKFESEFPDKAAKVIVMADLTYHHHVAPLVESLKEKGYTGIQPTEVVRDPNGLIPNRSIPLDLTADDLRTYSLFHVSDPPTSVLLALSSRFASLHVLSAQSSTVENPTMRTAGLLRRRFARVLSLASSGVIGILVNTLSIANSVSSIDNLRRKIADAGKKSYTVVVGRLNPAKLANFAEVEGWVVVGCWEGGLVEEDSGYWRPVITPFEMEVALMKEEDRIWGGEWWGGIEKLSLAKEPKEEKLEVREDDAADVHDADEGVEGEESMPPEYDLRTGKLVSHSRPMRLAVRDSPDVKTKSGDSEALIRRAAPGEVVSINGVASPGAEFLRSGRTWQGLGSDFQENNEASTVVEEGRRGVARGYVVGEGEKH